MRAKLTTDSAVKPRRFRKPWSPPYTRFFGVMAGAILAAAGLELFLMPHGIVVGGMTGLSVLLALTAEMKLGLFLFLLNLPLILLERKNIDAPFGLFTVCGLLVFSLGTLALHPYPALMSDPLPAALLGGLCLGLGLGFALRFGGALDTAGQAAKSLPQTQRKLFPSEGIRLLLNCTILLAAGFHFGFDQAVYSVTAYILAYESVKIPLHGIRLRVQVRIKTSRPAEIQKRLMLYLNREAVMTKEQNGEKQFEHRLNYLECQCHSLELPRLRALVKDGDRMAKSP
ncbi:YitT family protein [Paenibacillus sp. A14]|uniref:YitT family protein n=1 Tax=Paenibacillus sp. A14 TaxID=3119820 RepID=UPI002FDFBDE1